MKQAWKKYLLYGSVIVVGLALILAGYSAAWTGFGDYAPPNGDFIRGKTLWDWMELLVIPLVLAIGAFFLQRSDRAIERKAADDRAKLERELATDRQQEAALQAYLDRMAELVLKEKLVESDEKALNVARVRTLTALRGLNADRNGIVLRFLHDVGLAGKTDFKFFANANLQLVDLDSVDLSKTNLEGAFLFRANLRDANLEAAHLLGVHLQNANLRGANLRGANLRGAHLEGASLEGASLQGANLKGANLLYAHLEGANLIYAHLEGANLEYANLEGAEVTNEQLAVSKSLIGATMPDGSKHD